MYLLKYGQQCNPVEVEDIRFILLYLQESKERKHKPITYSKYFYRYEYLEALSILAVINIQGHAEIFMNPFITISVMCDLLKMPINEALQMTLDEIRQDQKEFFTPSDLAGNLHFILFSKFFGELEMPILNHCQENGNPDITEKLLNQLKYSRATFINSKFED